jgi:hypothetical protein
MPAHAAPPTAAALRRRRGLDLLARVGGAVSLASLLVLGAAVAAALGPAAEPAAGAPTVTVTIVER